MVTRWLQWMLLCTWTFCFLASSDLSRTFVLAQEQIQGERGVLLLERNRVIQGRISTSKDSYHVQQDSAGILIVPKSTVRFQGPDLRSVYVHLQDSLPQTASADDHVRLAHWCISNKLMPEARFELQTALDMEPSRDDIRRNLSIFDSHTKQPAASARSTKSLSPADRQMRTLGIGGDEVEALGGLSREAGQQFTTRIQPILVHNCTNSACHGPLAEHPLKFSIVRVGSASTHAVAEKNLLALLKYVDREKPKSSPLWKILATNHGAQGSSIFTGLKGPQQLQSFKDWVVSLGTAYEFDDEIPEEKPKGSGKRVAGTKNANGKQTRGTREKVVPPPEPKTKAEPDSDESPTLLVSQDSEKRTKSPTRLSQQRNSRIKERRPAQQEDEPAEPETPREVADSGVSETEVEPIVSTTRETIPELPPEDPFDPEVFNRRQRIKRNTAD